MSDLRTKFEEDRTKIVVAIVDERCVRSDRQTHRHTDVHSSDFISVQCYELHWSLDSTYTLASLILNSDASPFAVS